MAATMAAFAARMASMDVLSSAAYFFANTIAP
jgi:hypothetical protein